MDLRLPLVLSCALLAAACARDEPAATQSATAAAPARAVQADAGAAMRSAITGALTATRFANAPDRGALMAYPQDRVVRRDGAYTWHRTDLSEAHARAAVDGELRVPLPSGEELRFRFSRQTEHPSGDWTWVGGLAGDPSQRAIITFGEKAAFGLIDRPGEEPLRLTIRDGRTWLVETDRQRLAGVVNAATRPHTVDYLVPPRAADSSTDAEHAQAGTRAAMVASGTSATTTVDVAVGYTAGLATSLGGDAQAVTRVTFLAEVTNEAYANSQIDARVRVVHTARVSYPDATSNKTALTELTGHTGSARTTPNAAFTALRSARDQFGADLVVLVRKFNDPENEGCGIAWINGAGQGRISTSEESFGYSVVSDGEDRGTDGNLYFCRQETFAHELGHNMGAQHDRATADANKNGVIDAGERGVFDYALGYKAGATAGNFFTVMAYGDSGQTRYRVFSNPRITLCGGRPCGEALADNARALSQTIPQVAAFRATAVPLVTTPPRKILPRDADGNGRDDILWVRPSTGELYTWFMTGASPVNGRSGGFLPAGSTARGASDLNGDGFADIVASNGTTVQLYAGNGAGGYTVSTIGTQPSGFTLLAVEDTDGDGRADLVWHNASTGALHHWRMNGASVVASAAAGSVMGGAVPLGAADTSGDGRAEVLVATRDQLYMMNPGSTPTSYGTAYVGPRPIGWTLLGMRDVDADGKADLVWYHPDTREIYVWIMSGSSPVVGRGGQYVIHGTQPVAIADLDGNGRVDVLMSSGSHLYVMMANATSGYTASYVAPYPFSWNPL